MWTYLLASYLVLIGVSLFYALRYAKMTVDPDWAMFNMANFTGSWYGRDFVDCKSPAIHLLYWAIGKLVGRDVWAVRFCYHMLINTGAVLIFSLTHNFWWAFTFLVMINSGWMVGFHGNVGQVPAVMIAFALISSNPWASAVLWLVAVFFEPKLAPSWIVYAVITEAIFPTMTVLLPCAFIVMMIYIVKKEWWKWLWEANIVIPQRMRDARKPIWKFLLNLNFMVAMYLYMLPWLFLAIWTRPNPLYWLPLAIYVAVIYYGIAVRMNHLIPLVPWIALSGIAPGVAIALILSDWVAGNLYLGDIWNRFYPGIRDLNLQAKRVGEWLKDKPGTLWVSDLHSAVYIYAEKPAMYGLLEQIEIREVAKERREKMVQLWKERPPDWVVTGPSAHIKFSGRGYNKVLISGEMEVWRKSNGV